MAVINPTKRTILLADVPDDVYVFLLKEQNKIKEQKKVSKFSLERTLYKIIRATEDFKKCKDCK